ncbi:MAG: hypothetical protein EP302_04940 [Bacteroidetes bacterium]|jgi:hypothetical protein|nr:MAG: hypothetical protein EP302_04940 [Bacteroidota bacterium]UCE69831.1 MAG: hypothetical protein JSW57_02670 [Flavobacteriaceae bacterium]
MAFEELKNDLSDSQRAARDYIESTADYYRLKIFKFVMKAAIALTLLLFLGTLGLLALFFLSVAASDAIGNYLGNTTHGFLVVGGVYLIACLLAYLFRSRLERPVLKNFSKYYFEDK